MNGHRLYCYSVTGNTALACAMLSEEADSAGCPAPAVFDVEACDAPRREDLDGLALLGLAFPVMAFQPPLPIRDVVDRLPRAGDLARPPRAYLLVSGAWWTGNCFHKLAARLEARGYQVLGAHFVPAEESWTVTRVPWFVWNRGKPGPAERAGLRDFARALGAVARGAADRAGASCAWRPSRLHLDVAAWFHAPERKPWIWPKWIDRNRCTRCGRCIGRCPARALARGPDGFPAPRPRGCIGCFRCVNLCPAEAVDTRLTRGKLRFRGPGSTRPSLPDQRDFLRLVLLWVGLVLAAVALAYWISRS